MSFLFEHQEHALGDCKAAHDVDHGEDGRNHAQDGGEHDVRGGLSGPRREGGLVRHVRAHGCGARLTLWA